MSISKDILISSVFRELQMQIKSGNLVHQRKQRDNIRVQPREIGLSGLNL